MPHRRTVLGTGGLTPPSADREPSGERPDRLSTALAELAGAPAGDGRLARLRMRGLAFAERATTWGPVGPAAEVGWRTFRRDQAIAGSVLASAIAYRLFIWLLPLTLVMVAAVGIVADVQGDRASRYVADAGIGDLFADSVGAAAEATGFWGRIAVIVSAGVVLVYETYVLLRALRAVTAFAWGVPVRPMRNPLSGTLLLLALLTTTVVAAGLTGRVADAAAVPLGWLLSLASLAVLPVFFVLLSVWLLPNAATRWTEHLPGAILFYAALSAIHLFNALVLFPWVTRKEETYGVLGVAAGVLLSLFLMGRAIGLSAALNAVLREDRVARQG